MVNLCATFHLDIWLIIYYNEAMKRGQQRPPGKRPLSNATTWVNQSDRRYNMSMNELEAKVAELRELRRMAEELAGEIAATEDTLKAYMTANGADELYGPSFKITWKEVTSSRLDSKALKSAAPELWQRFSKSTTSRRFIVA